MAHRSESEYDCDAWMTHVRRGDLAAAWSVSDAILRRRLDECADCSDWPRHLQFIWNGQSLQGKRVLVRCYHGLGDTIQFVRLLAGLREQVQGITLWAQPSLLALLQTVPGIDRLLPLHEGSPDVDYDADVELMELQHVMRLTVDRIPKRVPYIYVSPAPRRSSADGLRHIGLVWRSGEWIPERSVPEHQIARLAEVPGVRWYSLRYPSPPLPFDAIDLARQDIGAVAAQMLALDLVISVDTMTAHLAGALGMPVWTLLHDDCDWRWMADRSETPWYPTMRLFRQRAGGGWDGVIDEVIEALGVDRVSTRLGLSE